MAVPYLLNSWNSRLPIIVLWKRSLDLVTAVRGSQFQIRVFRVSQNEITRNTLILAMQNMYLTFIVNKLNLLSKLENILLILILVLLFSIITSFFLNIKSSRGVEIEKDKLLKKEKLLINLKTSYENGRINAKEYKKRILYIINNNSI